MTTSAIAVTPGSGANIWTDQRTVSAVAREAQYQLVAEPAIATYAIVVPSVSAATTGSHLLQIMAGASNYVRLNSIRISQGGIPTLATTMMVELWRLSSAGTGPTSTITPRPFDTGDAAAGATAITLPSSKGTESLLLYRWLLPLVNANPTGAPVTWPHSTGRTKPMIIPVGTSYGVAFKVVTGVASVTLDIVVEITETAWL